MALVRNGRIEDNLWRAVEAGAPLEADARLLLGKADFLERRAALAGRNDPLGLILKSGETLAGLEDDIGRFALIVLDIPRYADGRLYSIARLLRERHGFTGELRASGDVLRDQIAFLYRVGVDSFDVTHEDTLAALLENKIVAVRRHYQRASRDDVEARVPGAPRERVSPPGQLPGQSSDLAQDATSGASA